MQLDATDIAIVRVLAGDVRASYSEISKVVGVSVNTVRNRISSLRESGALHMNVWLDPYRVGIGVTATFLIKVQGGMLDDVVKSVGALESTGYVAVLAGDHDLMVDAFCRDIPHLNQVLHEEIKRIDGVQSVSSNLVTDIRYDSSFNIVSIMGI